MAIILVLIAHFAPMPGLNTGRLGVDIFFVLSGFLMSRLLFLKPTPLLIFYKRRASRILPAFCLYVLVMMLYMPSQISLSELGASLTFLRSYFPADISIWKDGVPLGHLWSLNVEEHSYLWLSLGVVWSQGASNRSLILRFFIFSLFFIVAFNLIYPFHSPHGASPWHVRTECAAFGLILSAGYRVFKDGKHSTWINTFPAWFPLLTFFSAMLCYTPYAPHGSERLIAPVLLALTINHLNVTYEKVLSILSSPWLRWFGVCSFSIYLWQQPFHMAKLPPYVGVVLAILVGAISYYLIENPSRLWLNRVWASKTS